MILYVNDTMKRAAFFLIIVFAFWTQYAAAQNTLSFGADLNFSNKNLSNKTGVGLSAEYLNKTSPRGGIRVYSAYDAFHVSNDSHLRFVPLRAGYQQFIYSDNLLVYAETGIAGLFAPGSHHAGFSAAIGTGYKLNLPKAQLVQLSLAYNFVRYRQNYGWLAVRAAWGIKFGERKRYKRE